MNKLNKYTNKSIPLFWNNIDWFQQATRDAFEALMNAVGVEVDSNFVLTGCESSFNLGTGEWETTEGWLVINGEILHSEAQSVNVDGGTIPVYEIEETNDLTGTDQDSLGNTVQMHLNRHAKLIAVADPTGYFIALDPITIMDAIKAALFMNKTDWTVITTFYNGNLADTPAPQFRIDEHGLVHFKGKIDCQSATGTKCFLLPLAAHPPHVVHVVLAEEAGGSVQMGYITTNGEFYLYAAGYGNTGNKYHLTSIVPYQV